jgi:hypothetical protein
LEKTFTGYCRTQDGPRLVMLETESGERPEPDCDYFTCVYADVCPIGRAIKEELKEEKIERSI